MSHTTRKPRPNEVDGIDYHFTTHEDFKKMIDLKMFYEYAEIFGNFYGTSKQSVDEILGKKMIYYLILIGRATSSFQSIVILT